MIDDFEILKNNLQHKDHTKPYRRFGLKTQKIKNRKAILLSQLGILIFFGGYFAGLPSSSGQHEEMLNPAGLFSTVYQVENLRGDSINLYKYWRILPGTTLSVNIINPVSMPNESIEIIKNSIMSTETMSIDDSLLHKGPKKFFFYVLFRLERSSSIHT